MKIRSWNGFGAKSRPGRLQDAPGRTSYWTFDAFLVENGARRGHFGAQLGAKVPKIKHFRTKSPTNREK